MSVDVRVDLGGTSWDGTFEHGHPGGVTITGPTTDYVLHLCIYDARTLLRLLGKALTEYEKRFPEPKP